jgi:hypothetical protein
MAPEDKDFNPVFTNTQPAFTPPQEGPGWEKLSLHQRAGSYKILIFLTALRHRVTF